MRDVFVDVNCEFDLHRLCCERDPERVVLDVSREVAARLCAEAGAELRTDRPPELVISKGIKPESGRDVLLVAARWAVTAPETVAV